MLTPDQTLNLYPELSDIKGEKRKILIEVIEKYHKRFKDMPRKDNGDFAAIIPDPVEVRRAKKKMDEIALHICSLYNTTVDELKSPSKKRELVDARALFMATTYREVDIAMCHASKHIGRKHAAGLHLIKNVAPFKEVADHIPKVIKLL